ncbi:hypothetical protein KAI87_02070 [Myxococcota bacterium]|nr:hypothetical protein [Myxococcota bacterium]
MTEPKDNLVKSNKKKLTPSAAARAADDQVIRDKNQKKPPSMKASATSGLPVGEPVGNSFDEHKRGFIAQIAEVEDAMRYMGTSHPDRAGKEARIKQLKMLLEQMEKSIAAANAVKK